MKPMLATALLALTMAGPAAAQSFGGNYDVKGTNLDGSAYGGTAVISLASRTTCTIEWETAGVKSHGICSRNDDAFAAAYVLGKAVGLVIYKVRPDGSLDGVWTIQGQDGNGKETLTPK